MSKRKPTEVEQMHNDFAKSTSMPIVDTPQPPNGNTTFAKDTYKNQQPISPPFGENK